MTGATGFIGHHLVAQLLWQGFSVRILTRGVHPLPKALAQQVEIVYGDMVDKISILKSVSGCDIVFHLAGERCLGCAPYQSGPAICPIGFMWRGDGFERRCV